MQETYYSNHFVLIGLLLDNSFSVCYVRAGITESLFEYQHYNFRIAFIIEIPSKPCSKYRQLLQYPRVWGFFFQMRPLNNCYFGFVFYLQNFETVLCCHSIICIFCNEYCALEKYWSAVLETGDWVSPTKTMQVPVYRLCMSGTLLSSLNCMYVCLSGLGNYFNIIEYNFISVIENRSNVSSSKMRLGNTISKNSFGAHRNWLFPSKEFSCMLSPSLTKMY